MVSLKCHSFQNKQRRKCELRGNPSLFISCFAQMRFKQSMKDTIKLALDFCLLSAKYRFYDS